MYHLILVPLDGSPRAESILPHVRELAKRFGSRIELLTVLEPVIDEKGSPFEQAGALIRSLQQSETTASQSSRTAQIEKYLNRLCEQFEAEGIAAESHIVSGGPVVDGIIRVAEREGADLIAMASHGRTGLAQVFYGSVAAGILQRIDRPLLLIRSRDRS